MPTRLIATSFALIAFATAVLTGIIADHAAGVILYRALIAMVGCYLAGLVIGAMAFRALQDQIQRYKRAHPLEPADDESATPQDALASSSSDPSEQSQSSASAAADRTTSSTSSKAAA
ncbi:MAG: hypothetical protein WD294_15830 [Phycisphaeraceae bacterium]